MMYLIQHDGDIGPMPDHWRKRWKHIMPWQTYRLYEHLHDPQYENNDQAITPHFLSQLVGISRTAIVRALFELEENSFVEINEDDDGITTVTVYEPPLPDEVGEVMNEMPVKAFRSDFAKARNIRADWCQLYLEYVGAEYVWRQKDEATARQLAKAYPEDIHIRNLIRFYWRHCWDGELEDTFPNFRLNLHVYEAEKAQFDRSIQ